MTWTLSRQGNQKGHHMNPILGIFLPMQKFHNDQDS